VVTTSLRVTRPLLVVVVVVSFTTVPSGWVVVVVLLLVEVELVVTGEGGTATGGGAVFDEEQPAIQPQTAITPAKPASFPTELMQFRLPTLNSRVKHPPPRQTNWREIEAPNTAATCEAQFSAMSRGLHQCRTPPCTAGRSSDRVRNARQFTSYARLDF
jgi:hypothetical protein